MEPHNYFDIAHFLVQVKQNKIPLEIFYRTAINRLYYGIFHLVQFQFKILIPQSEIKRCHAFVKEKIEHTNILGDYSELEAYRVDADYKLTKITRLNHYQDALKIQKRILDKIIEPEHVPYEENDEEFFFKHKKS
ncbi:MAG: hypothetical protein ACFFBP_20130 [Promethearchaeota archaeon]